MSQFLPNPSVVNCVIISQLFSAVNRMKNGLTDLEELLNKHCFDLIMILIMLVMESVTLVGENLKLSC